MTATEAMRILDLERQRLEAEARPLLRMPGAHEDEAALMRLLGLRLSALATAMDALRRDRAD